MINNLTPRYVSTWLPPYVHEVSSYALRNNNDLYKPKIRKGYVLNSFLWSSVEDWNRLPLDIRQCFSIIHFKERVKSHLFQKPNVLFNHGCGKGAVNHARLRMGLSALNAHRKKYNFIRINDCPLCGTKPENETHFLLKCPGHAIPRTVLMGTITPIIATLPDIEIPPRTKLNFENLTALLLNGHPDLTMELNTHIFSAVQVHINESHRF